MQRITRNQLELQAERINRIMGAPLTRWNDNGKMNVGHHYISCAYGGYSLARIANDGGGESCPLHTGYIPARELSGLMYAYIYGLMDGERMAQQVAA